MNEYFVGDMDNNSQSSVLATTSSDEFIRNAHLININKIETEDDPEYWNRKYKENDWDHLYG